MHINVLLYYVGLSCNKMIFQMLK
uniref:Uncharacterized protein n=1 Tax=Rhizophora mucronata TaxID=61149 RepID=A0A2P2NCW2_RHIMU